MHKKPLPKGKKTQIDIYFISSMQLKFGIDPLYPADHLTHSITVKIYIYAVLFTLSYEID